MKLGKRKTTADDPFAGGPSGGITAENYAERCSAFLKARGGKGVIIRALEGTDGSMETKHEATEPQWLAWISYFGDRGIPHAFAVERGFTTVPAEWPEDFDYEANASDRSARIAPPRALAGRGRQEWIARGLRSLAAAMAASDHRRPRNEVSPETLAPPPPTLNELAKKFAADAPAPLGAWREGR